VFSWHDF
jgi:hypothetical protein